MFNGIIEQVSPVLSASARGRIHAVRFKLPPRWKLARGQSVSVNGICSTVTETGRGWFSVGYMPETLAKTTAASFTNGTLVNLERSLRYGDPIDGHFVQGHVEGVAKIERVEREGESRRVFFRIPKSLVRYVATKGSIALNGASLTVARSKGAAVEIALIPFTLAHTNLGMLSKGDAANIETDMLARRAKPPRPRSGMMASDKKRRA